MKISNFEEFVSSKILARGLNYYNWDQVMEVAQIEKGEFSAVVEGSTDYEVSLRLDEHLNIIGHSCDCPYDWGNICKHEVAVMYYVRENKLYEKEVHENIFHKMRNDLSQYSRGSLVEIIMNLSKKSATIRKEIVRELDLE